MSHEQCGLTARLWQSCGSARKTSRIARSCRLCRRCHISRYRRTVCTAARSGTCDQRERGVRHLTAVRRATPKRKERSWPACSPTAGAPVASTSLRLPTTQQAELIGALTAQGQINRGCFRRSTADAGRRAVPRSRPTILADDSGFTVDEPKETLGNAIKLPPWCESRRAEIVAALAPLR